MKISDQTTRSPNRWEQISFLFGMIGWGSLLLLGVLAKFEINFPSSVEFAGPFLALAIPVFSLWGIGFGIGALVTQIRANKIYPERKRRFFLCCLGITISLLLPLAECGWILSNMGCKPPDLLTQELPHQK